jgi:hypothetical protein
MNQHKEKDKERLCLKTCISRRKGVFFPENKTFLGTLGLLSPIWLGQNAFAMENGVEI